MILVIFAGMLKRRIYIFLLLFAFGIIVGHNFIPHHHHDIDHHKALNYQHNHHHGEVPLEHDHNENNHDDNGLNHFFSHFFHHEDGLIFTVNHSISNSFSKQAFLFIALVPDTFYFIELPIPPLLHHLPSEHLICISTHFHTPGMRGPPVQSI